MWGILISYSPLQIKKKRIKKIKMDMKYKVLVMDLIFDIMIDFSNHGLDAHVTGTWLDIPHTVLEEYLL